MTPTDAIKIYRIESPIGRSLWYTPDGNYNPFIFNLTEGKAREFPMDFDQKFKAKGMAWFSGCKDINDMRKWFSKLDMQELAIAGYSLYEFNVGQYILEPMQVLFTRESIKVQLEIPVATIWG